MKYIARFFLVFAFLLQAVGASPVHAAGTSPAQPTSQATTAPSVTSSPTSKNLSQAYPAPGSTQPMPVTPIQPVTIPNATPTPTPTVVSSNPIKPSKGTLTLAASQDYILAGGNLTLNWTFQANPSSALDQTKLDLALALPDGFALSKDLAIPVDSTTLALTTTLQSFPSTLNLTVGNVGSGPSVFYARVLQAGQEIASASLTVELATDSQVDASGGTASSAQNTIQVIFPQGALSEATNVLVRPINTPGKVPFTIGGHAFEILATSVSSQAVVHQFPKPINIQVSYDPYIIQRKLGPSWK